MRPVLVALACVLAVEAGHLRKKNHFLNRTILDYYSSQTPSRVGGYAPGCSYCPALESPSAPFDFFYTEPNGFSMVNQTEACFVKPVPLLVDEPYIHNKHVQQHCGCAMRVFEASGQESFEALGDSSCASLHRWPCGFWWTASKSGPKDDVFVAFEDPNIMVLLGHDDATNGPANYALNHSLSFHFDDTRQGRMIMECGHCLRGWLEGKINQLGIDAGQFPYEIAGGFFDFTKFYDYENATAGWNEAQYQATKGTTGNDVLHLRHRITGVFGCIPDPCFGENGDDLCHAQNRYSCNIDSPLKCGPCRCDYGPGTRYTDPADIANIDEATYDCSEHNIELYACNTCDLDSQTELGINEMSVAEEAGTRLEVHGKTGDIYIGMATANRTDWDIDHPNGWREAVGTDMVDPFRIRIRLGAIAEMEESYDMMDYASDLSDGLDGDDQVYSYVRSKGSKGVHGDGMQYGRLPKLKDRTPHEWTCPLPYDWRQYPHTHSKGKSHTGTPKSTMHTHSHSKMAPDGWEDWAVDIMNTDIDGNYMPVAKEACEWNVVGPALCRYPGTTCYGWTTTLDHDGLIYHNGVPHGSAHMQTWLFNQDCNITENGKTFTLYKGDVKFKTAVTEWPYCTPFVTGVNDDSDVHVNYCPEMTDGRDGADYGSKGNSMHSHSSGDDHDFDDCPHHAVGDYLEWSLDIYDNDGRMGHRHGAKGHYHKGSKSGKADWTRGAKYRSHGKSKGSDHHDGADWVACDWEDGRMGAAYCHELGFGIEGMFCPQSILGGTGVSHPGVAGTNGWDYEYRMRQPYPAWEHRHRHDHRHDYRDGDDLEFVFPAYDMSSTNNDTDESCDPEGPTTPRHVNHIYDSTIFTNAIHGGWTKWGHCEAKCLWSDDVTVYKKRACTSPMPRYDGDECEGPDRMECTHLKMCPNAPPAGSLAIEFLFTVPADATKGKSKANKWWSKSESEAFIATLAVELGVNEVAFGPVTVDRNGRVRTYLQCSDLNTMLPTCFDMSGMTLPGGGTFIGRDYIRALEGVQFEGSLANLNLEVDRVYIEQPSKSTPVAAIVGGSIGGVFLIALVALGAFKMSQRPSTKETAATDTTTEPAKASGAAVDAGDLMLSI